LLCSEKNTEEIAHDYDELGMYYIYSGDAKKGHKYIKAGLKIRQKLYSEDHANIATSFSHLGFALYSLGE
jgi:hypothetical protein